MRKYRKVKCYDTSHTYWLTQNSYSITESNNVTHTFYRLAKNDVAVYCYMTVKTL